MHLFKPRTCVLLCLILVFVPNSITTAQQGGPPLLTYDDLVTLYEKDVPPPELAARLQRLLTTPFVHNSAGVRGPKAGSQDDLGKQFIRVATWNIERGVEFEAIKAALANDQRYFRRLPYELRSSRFKLNEILDQAEKLSRADVIVLNEVDWGVKRTKYRNVARELATALQMNYAFGVEFVEVAVVVFVVARHVEHQRPRAAPGRGRELRQPEVARLRGRQLRRPLVGADVAGEDQEVRTGSGDCTKAGLRLQVQVGHQLDLHRRHPKGAGEVAGD